MKLYIPFTALLLVVSLNAVAEECPKVAGYTDRNCDGEFRIVFTGDSLVYGIGDSQNKNKGGYVLRVAKKLKGVTVENFGVPGASADELLASINAGFSDAATKRQEAFATALENADVVVVDLGRNDYFRNNRTRTPQQTFAFLKQINSTIKEKAKNTEGVSPYVVQAVLMRPNRTDQGVYVKALDSIILKSNSANFPTDLRFDLVSKRLLNKDQIHPTPRGYDSIAKVFLDYLKKKIAPRL